MPSGFYIYDLEIFSNFFSGTFVDLYSDEHFAFVIHESRDDRKELVDFMKSVRGLVGFNNLFFDSPLLRFVLQNIEKKNLNKPIFELTQKLISNFSSEDDEIRKLRFPRKEDWRDLDLMRLTAADKLGMSLKMMAVNLRWYKIQDLPFHHESEISAEQIEEVLSYNLNDVLITKNLYQRLQPEIQLRKELGKLYDVNVSSASDSKIANVILEHMITDDKDKLKEIRNLRTQRKSVKLSDCIPHNLNFQHPKLCGLLDHLMGTTVYESDKFKYSLKLEFGGNIYQMGVGGLHSEDNAADFKSDDQYVLRDADVASFYPAIVINLGIRPEHLGDKFTQIFKQMTNDRLKAKKNKDDIRAAAMKIVINSCFGKFGSPLFWLYDPLAMLRTTLAGQLYLLRLIEMLHAVGIQTISANTDGIVCKIKRGMEDIYHRVCDEWQKETDFSLEFVDYKRIVRRDVNNYLAVTSEGKVKTKGVFAAPTSLTKGYKFPIIQKCLYEYFANDIPVDETLENCKDVLDFAAAQKIGGQFIPELHTLDAVTPLQKTNRYAVSRKGGAIMKRHKQTGKLTSINAGESCILLNDIDPNAQFEDYEINLDFYRNEVNKIVEQIEPRFQQLSLFA